MSTFQCSQCGLCCTNIKVVDGPLFDEFLEDVPGYFAIPADQVGLSLYGWEKKILEAKAAELGITITFEPFRVVLDEKSGLNIVVSWSLVEDPCPFYMIDGDSTLCPIHSSRPLVCKYFPILATCFSDLCPSILKGLNFDEDMPQREKMIELYGEQYLAMMAVIKTHIQIISMLKDMRDAKVIQPFIIENSSPTIVQILMENKRTIDVLDFFVECKDVEITREGVEEFIALYSDPERLAREGHI